MRYILALTVILTTAALGAMDTSLDGEPNGSGVLKWAHSGSKDIVQVIQDNLVTESGQITNGYSLYGGNNWWGAIDWIVTDNDWTFRRWTHDVIPLGATKFDMFMEIYEDDLNSSPIDSFTVTEGDITSTDTGLTAFGYPIYRNVMDVNPTTNPFRNGGTYWIAISYDATDNLFWTVREDSVVDDYIYFYDGSGWYSAPDFFGENTEGSYMIEGSIYEVAVESASLGTVKAAFK
ncbi:MAG: hypothetical protein GY771_00795 [bacterium]|nr:hypothetical protein [bacterium]